MGCARKPKVRTALWLHEHRENLSLLPVSLVCCCLTAVVFLFFFILCIAAQLFLLLHLHVWAACCHRSIVLSASPFYCKRMSASPLKHTHTHTRLYCYVCQDQPNVLMSSITSSFWYLLCCMCKNTPICTCGCDTKNKHFCPIFLQ